MEFFMVLNALFFVMSCYIVVVLWWTDWWIYIVYHGDLRSTVGSNDGI